MALVIDASVAIHWYLGSEHAEAALALLDHDVSLLAPDLLPAEVGNTLVKYVAGGDIAQDDAPAILSGIQAAITRFTAMASLHDRALALALELRHPIYDCYYLALALREGVPFVTLDQRLKRKLEGTAHQPLAVHLTEWRP